MKKINQYIIFCLLALWATISLHSCKDELNNNLPNSGLFRPQFTDVEVGGNWIKLKWDRYEPAENFTIELSVDTFKTIYREVNTDEDTYTFTDVDFDMQYWIRIKSFAGDLMSKIYQYPYPIRTADVPTNLDPVLFVTDKSVRVSWQEASYDSLLVGYMDGQLVKVVKTVKNLNNDSKTVDIDGLNPLTNYLVMAHSGGEYQGKQRFKTSEALVIFGNIIDLRDPNYHPELADVDKFTQALSDYVAGAVPTTIVLKGGTEYYYTNRIALNAALSIIADYSLDGNAIIRRSQQFDCVNPGFVGGSMHFTRVSFLNHPSLAISGKGTYLFAAPRMTVDTISFESCEIRYARGMFSANEGFSVGLLSFNNCVVDSILDMPIMRNRDGADPNRGKVFQISITNSTLSNLAKGIYSNDAYSGTTKVTLRNVTWVNLPANTTILQFSKETSIAAFEIKNCIFAGAWNPSTTSEVTPVRGVNAGAYTPSFANNYITKEIAWGSDLIVSTTLDVDKNELFVDPGNRNYTLTSKAYAPGAGDPRWWLK